MGNRWYGKVGFADQVEVKPGIWANQPIEREYYGETLGHSRSFQASQNSINDDITVSATISIVADEYADLHCHSMLYVQYMGANWKVSRVEVQRPRLILTLGGLYNGS